jgi:hypothetical protein
MTELLHSIFSEAPWLKSFLAWTVACALVVAMCTLPAYYLLLRLTQRLRRELSLHLRRVRDRHAQQRAARSAAEQTYLDQYASDRLLRHLDTTSERLWARTKTTLIEPARDIQRRLASVMSGVAGFTKALPDVHERLRGITDGLARDFQPTTGEAGLTQATGNVRVARLALATSSFLLIAIITVNTGMLSQIVRDLGFIPASLAFLGIPLFWILALLITCVESGLGAIHGILSDSDMGDEDRKIRFGPLLAAVGAVGVACVEGFFYSRINPNRSETVTIPLISYTLPQTDLFFLWGFLLVMTLFGLGLICYRMAAKVLRGTALSALRKQLRALTRDTTHWSTALRQAEAIATTARAAVAGGQTTTESKLFAADAVERLLSELQTLVQTRPPWVSVLETALGVSEVRHLARHCLLWLVLAIATIGIAIATGIATFGRIVPEAATAIAVAIGQAALCATAGLLLGWGETVVQGPDWQKVMAPAWGRGAGLVLTGVLTFAELALLRTAYTAGIMPLWISNLFVCLVVIAVCYQLVSLLGLSGLWAQRALHLTMSLGEAAYRSLIVLLLFVTGALFYISAILAGPFLVLKGHPADLGDSHADAQL